MVSKVLADFESLEVGCVKSHFLDSGAFTLWTTSAQYAKENKTDRWAFYYTDEFWQYCDDYADFIKKYSYGIDLYANVDVIPNPKLTYRNQKYLEDCHELTPVPVVHYTTDLKWLRRYIDEGYKIIGLGGLVGSTSEDSCKAWIDAAFEIVCNTPDRLPKVKIHGFGVTTYTLMTRYPWWSVDSTTWTKIGAYGGIFIPHKRGGKFVFNVPPYLMKVSNDAPDRKLQGKHVLTISPLEKKIVQEWLDFIGIPLGKYSKGGEVLEHGVVTRHTERRGANLLFFEMMRRSLPKYPWPFTSKRRKGAM